MWIIACLLFSLSLFDLCPSVCWFWLHKCCLPTFLMLIGSQIVIVFSTGVIFCSYLYSNQFTSIHEQLDKPYLSVCIKLFFPCCNLQSMNIFNWWSFFIFSNYMWDVTMKRKSLSYDGEQFHQYQQTYLLPQNHRLQ